MPQCGGEWPHGLWNAWRQGGSAQGEANGNYRHGRHTKEAKAQRLRRRSERIRLAALLRAFDASDGSEADLTATMKAAGLL